MKRNRPRKNVADDLQGVFGVHGLIWFFAYVPHALKRIQNHVVDDGLYLPPPAGDGHTRAEPGAAHRARGDRGRWRIQDVLQALRQTHRST